MALMKSVPHVLHVHELLEVLDEVAPFRLAESWDNVGLQIGHPGRPAGAILIALELSPDVMEEARSLNAGTLLTHHPLIFKPLRNIDESNPGAALVAEVIRAGMNHVAVHTNFDSIAEGTNGEIADRLKLRERTFLRPAPASRDRVKYVVFVPSEHAGAIIEAAARAGAGLIGDYSHCTFRSKGTGTYKPLPGANPFAGTVGRLEQATGEERLEIVCPKNRLAGLIQAVSEVHPYEEVAYDIYALEPSGPDRYGCGITGALQKPQTLRQFVLRCKRAFSIRSVGVGGDLEREVSRISVCSGGAGDFVGDAAASGADVFVTGEMSHHDCALARDLGLSFVLLGHHNSEAIAGERLADLLRKHPLIVEKKAEISVSSQERSPVDRL